MGKENIRTKIIEILGTMTSYYFEGGKFEDQDLYCEDIADKILAEIEKEKLGLINKIC